jgi:hypothetical protein
MILCDLSMPIKLRIHNFTHRTVYRLSEDHSNNQSYDINQTNQPFEPTFAGIFLFLRITINTLYIYGFNSDAILGHVNPVLNQYSWENFTLVKVNIPACVGLCLTKLKLHTEII